MLSDCSGIAIRTYGRLKYRPVSHRVDERRTGTAQMSKINKTNQNDGHVKPFPFPLTESRHQCLAWTLMTSLCEAENCSQRL